MDKKDNDKMIAEIMKRRGTFEFPSEFVRFHPNLAFKLMGHLLIVKAEHRFAWETLWYEGYSLLFDMVEEGVSSPHYYLGVKENGEIVCQTKPLVFAKTGYVITCEFGDGTVDLFPYEFDRKLKRYKYRSKYAVDIDDRGRVFYNITTGDQVVIE